MRFDLKPERLIGDTAAARRPCSRGWCRTRESRRTFRFGTRHNAKTKLPAASFGGTDKPMNTAAGRGAFYAANGTHSRTRVLALPRPHQQLSIQPIRSASCPMKARCRPNTPIRKIARSVHESARDDSRDIARTSGYRRSHEGFARRSKSSSHISSGVLKLDRLRLRGLSGANDEFLLAATVQNLATNGEVAHPHSAPAASRPHKRKSGADSLHLARVTESSPLPRSPDENILDRRRDCQQNRPVGLDRA